jgi:hypothetical protein
MLTFRDNKNVWLMCQNQVSLFPKSHVAVPGNDLHIQKVSGRLTNNAKDFIPYE